MTHNGILFLADAIAVGLGSLLLYFIVTNWGNKSC